MISDINRMEPFCPSVCKLSKLVVHKKIVKRFKNLHTKKYSAVLSYFTIQVFSDHYKSYQDHDDLF